MNDICKKSISERLMEAQEKEGLQNSDVAGLLGVTSNVVWCAKNSKYWRNFSEARWDLLQKWCNSGLSLKAYGKNGGHFVPTENVASDRFTPTETYKEGDKVRVLEMVEKTVIPAESVPEPSKTILTLGDVSSLQEKEKSAPRLSKGQMVDLLLEEKELLKQKIDAIDVLLKFYIS